MNEIVENFKISLIEDDKSPKTKAFIEFPNNKGVDFDGKLQWFYVVSYKNFLVDSNYEVATNQ